MFFVKSKAQIYLWFLHSIHFNKTQVKMELEMIALLLVMEMATLKKKTSVLADNIEVAVLLSFTRSYLPH